jgi:hypothetical protein
VPRRRRLAKGMTTPPVQLLTFAFGPDAVFEGQMLGAVERLESGGALRVLQVIFVRRGQDGVLSAFAHRGGTMGGIAEPALEFRLDEHERQRATERALAGAAGSGVRALADELAPGGAVAAVFVEHRWLADLSDATERTGGIAVSSDFVDAEAVARELSS